MLQMLEAWGWPYELRAIGNRCKDWRLEQTHITCTEQTQKRHKMHCRDLTAAGAYLDEAALFPKSFVDQAIARCSVDGLEVLDELQPGRTTSFYT